MKGIRGAPAVAANLVFEVIADEARKPPLDDVPFSFIRLEFNAVEDGVSFLGPGPRA